MVTLLEQVKKLGFGSTPKGWVPALYEWLLKYKAALTSKFSLYFYELLSHHGPAQEVKCLLSRTVGDYYGK